MTKMQASPAKLRNGAWGARTQGIVAVNDVISITTRSGQTWDARVTSIVFTSKTSSVVTTESVNPTRGRSQRPRRSRRRFVPCGYPGCSAAYCDECDGEGG